MDDTPQYVQPPPDRAVVQLQQQSANDRLAAMTDEIAAANARHAATYGTPNPATVGTPAAVANQLGGADLSPFGTFAQAPVAALMNTIGPLALRPGTSLAGS